MRIWTVHPKFLDQKGLGGAWREALGAQKSLNYLNKGIVIGYSNHSQLIRFKQLSNPLQAMCNYMHKLVDEAITRNYNFNRSLILLPCSNNTIIENDGQLRYEWNWLMSKLLTRCPDRWKIMKESTIEASPVFDIIPGPIQTWEKIK